MKKKVVLIAAGGTGGHIYPALAIAHALESLDRELVVEFVGTPSGLENQLVPREGFALHQVAVGRLNRNVRTGERLKTLVTLPWGLLRAAWLVWRRRPVLVLGVGGFVTGPVVLAAALLRRPSFLWEPNAHPGLANRWLAPFVRECLVVFPEAAKLLHSSRIRRVGMPVRAAVEEVGASTTASPHPRLRVLVFGGSQGARAINEVMMEMARTANDALKDFEFVHQTGPADVERVRAVYRQAHADIEVHAYIHDMAKRYQWADVVVARAGTGTVSELAACGKAALLVPLPTAADDHQRRNAESLVAAEAAIMVLQRDLTAPRLLGLLEQFRQQRELIDRLGRNIRKFHSPRADLAIARHLLEALNS